MSVTRLTASSVRGSLPATPCRTHPRACAFHRPWRSPASALGAGQRTAPMHACRADTACVPRVASCSNSRSVVRSKYRPHVRSHTAQFCHSAHGSRRRHGIDRGIERLLGWITRPEVAAPVLRQLPSLLGAAAAHGLPVFNAASSLSFARTGSGHAAQMRDFSGASDAASRTAKHSTMPT